MDDQVDPATDKDGAPPPNPVTEARAPQFALTGQQRALVKALDEQRGYEGLADMYRGGLVVLADSTNPDRLPLCAHAMRELMEKLPERLEVETQAQHESLKAKVREVEGIFVSIRSKTACHDATEGWRGPIDRPLGRFLSRFERFLEWFNSHAPRRRDEVHGALTRLDGSGRQLPGRLAELNVDVWQETHDYFQSVAHHRRLGTDEEMRQWLDALERFLLDRLKPRTYEDLEEIDALLAEENPDA